MEFYFYITLILLFFYHLYFYFPEMLKHTVKTKFKSRLMSNFFPVNLKHPMCLAAMLISCISFKFSFLILNIFYFFHLRIAEIGVE